MIELTIVASIAIIVLAVLLVLQQHNINAERADWALERQRLTDRVIARHVGEVVAMDNQRTRQTLAENNGPSLSEAANRPLIEGLS